MNSIVVEGWLTAPADVKDCGNSKVCNFSVADNKTFSNRAGEKVKKTTFFDCEFWGKRVENLSPYLKKGTHVCAIGEMQQQNWVDEAGVNRKKMTVLVSQIKLLQTKEKTVEAKQAVTEEALADDNSDKEYEYY